MAKPQNQFETLARDAAERIDAARDAGQQLALLPDELEQAPSDRPPRGKGKVNSQLREWLATKGYRMPEDVLAEMAALATSDDVFTWAMARAEQMLAWAQSGAVGVKGQPAVQTMTQRIEAFRLVYMAALRAAEAAMPYGAAKVTPDVSVTQNTTVVVPAAPSGRADPGATARDVTPRPGGRMAPPPLPGEMQRNQWLDEDQSGGSDA